MNEYLNYQFDPKLKKLKSDGLTWLPWVGKLYTPKHARRILIVGESHYSTEPDEAKLRKVQESHLADDKYTRDIILEYQIEKAKHIRTLENIERAIVGEPRVDGAAFWSQVAYCNFIQRLMNYHQKERPTGNEFYNSWKIFVRIVEVLKPTSCIFAGIGASYSFNQAMDDLDLKHESVKWNECIGTTYGRTASLSVGGKPIALVSIQHPGTRFSWSQWHGFLQRHCGMSLLRVPKAH